jgi:succinate dehydrogenase/fumarate reductase cytochrome b subunit
MTASSTAEPADSPPRERRVQWGAVAGSVVLAYTVLYSLAMLDIGDRNRFNGWGRAMGSLGARLVLSGVVLAALFHTFDGLRRMAIDLRPELAEQNARWRATVLFFTWALAIPAATVIVWPWVSASTR